MTLLALVLVAVSWTGIIWHFFGVILILLCIFLTVIILMQDSKGAGLTSAFGAGPGGESLLGARMQKDVARWTAITAGFFAAIVLVMGLLGTHIIRYGTVGAAGAKSAPAAAAPETPPRAEKGPSPAAPPTGNPSTGGAALPAPSGATTTAPSTPAAGSQAPAPGTGSATPPSPPPSPPPPLPGPETGSEKK